MVRGYSARCLNKGRSGVSEGLAGRSPQRLALLQVAGAFALLVSAALLAQSFSNLVAQNLGFGSKDVLVARVFPDASKYATTSLRLAYFGQLRQRIQALPQVESAGFGTGLPLNEFNNTPSFPFWAAGEPKPRSVPEATTYMVTPGYFQALKTPLLAGRLFDERDRTDSQPVIIINRTLSRRAWPEGGGAGKLLRAKAGNRAPQDFMVIGVVADVRSRDLRTAPTYEMFRPHTQVPYATMNLVARVTVPPMSLEPQIRALILDLDATQPAHSVTTLAELTSNARSSERFALQLFLVLSGLALMLALSGLYGLYSYNVVLRTHEIGVRMSLGATRSRILGFFLMAGTFAAGRGILLGLIPTWILSRGLAPFLFEVEPLEPQLLIVTAFTLMLCALAATAIPALRATRVDPLKSLGGA